MKRLLTFLLFWALLFLVGSAVLAFTHSEFSNGCVLIVIFGSCFLGIVVNEIVWD